MPKLWINYGEGEVVLIEGAVLPEIGKYIEVPLDHNGTKSERKLFIKSINESQGKDIDFDIEADVSPCLCWSCLIEDLFENKGLKEVCCL